MQLSNQAAGAIMLAVTKGMLLANQGNNEDCDITEILKGFVFSETEEGLVVENPPILEMGETTEDTEGITTDAEV